MFNRYTPVPPISSPDATDGSAQDVLTERWKQRIATLKDKEDCDDAVQAKFHYASWFGACSELV